ncbi:MAG: heme exporter protein CcmB [Anaerolineae bacterium]|nr:heme exporter protein CcmB [Anaerolineae bacterium]NUQ05393.1 heme exporter protein CcmB [Anaerolineae bacterium]
MKTPFFKAALSIVRKDFLAELRSRELVGAMGLFVLLSVLVFSFALELNRQARAETVGGVLWVTVVFASILGLNRSMAMEREQGNFEALLIAPIDRAALYVGKLIGNYVFTVAVSLPLLVVMTVLYNVAVITPEVIGVLLLGAFGMTVVGTLLAAMTVQTRAREALLPIIMLPIVLPVLLAAVRATNAILSRAPLAQWSDWLLILVVLAVIYLVMCLLTFGFIVEE